MRKFVTKKIGLGKEKMEFWLEQYKKAFEKALKKGEEKNGK